MKIKHLMQSVRHTVGALLLCICGMDAMGQSAGTSIAAPFLSVSPDARTAGMAGMTCGITGDPNNGFTNTAKLFFMEENTSMISSNFIPFSAIARNAYMTSIAFADRWNNTALFLGARYISYGQATLTDNNDAITGLAQPSDLVLQAGYAMSLSKKISIATTMGYIYSHLLRGTFNGVDYSNASTAMADVSVMYQGVNGDTYEGWCAGLAINHIGEPLHYTSNTTSYLPGSITVCASYTFASMDGDNTFTIGEDIEKPFTNEHLFHIEPGMGYLCGVEYCAEPSRTSSFSLRAGYRIATEGSNGPTAGIGFVKDKIGINIAYQYTNSFDPTSNTMRIGLLYTF